MVYTLAFLVGSLFGTYLILRLLMLVCRKLRRRPNGALEIASMGILTLAFSHGCRGVRDAGRRAGTGILPCFLHVLRPSYDCDRH